MQVLPGLHGAAQVDAGFTQVRAAPRRAHQPPSGALRRNPDVVNRCGWVYVKV